MVFKNFRLHVILRAILLTACITIFSWCIVHEFYLRSIYAGVVVIVTLIELIWYVDRFNRDIKTFMVSLLERDFTTHYEDTNKGKSFNALYEILNAISGAFKKISVEKEIQHRYLEMLVDHVQVGILSFDQHEKIHLANTAIKKLLHRQVLMHLDNLNAIDPTLLSAARTINAGEVRLVKIKIGQELLQLSLHAATFKLEDQYFKLVSMQNIRTELDAREMEAWQKLIRVMTHEIMNSITPITSLSSTLHELVKQHQAESTEDRIFHTLDQGLDAIRIRSEGLHHFTEAYRRLTRIPTPTFRKTNVKALLQRVETLFAQELRQNNIDFVIQSTDVESTLDPELMEQVIINLLRNAIEAMDGQRESKITMEGIVQADGKILLRITDNGMGMDPETVENIFIPFFTTKKSGSGIGLALAKQILQLHHAEIKVSSTPGEGTVFSVLL